MLRRFFHILALACLLAVPVRADVVNLRLGPQGEVLAWLAVGPFPNPGTENMTCRGFDTDVFPGGEAEARAVEGGKVASTNGMLAWKLALADEKSGLDFLPRFGGREPGVAYAYAGLASPSASDARLLLGSDDGVKVWVNGEPVFATHVTRGVKRDEDAVDIRLNAGANHLLFKVDQHFGGWGLMARIVGTDRLPVAGLVERLDVRRSDMSDTSDRSDRSDTAIVRRMVGKSGSLDMCALNRYISWRRKTDTWKPWLRPNVTVPQPPKSGSPEKVSKALSDAADSLERQFKAEWQVLTQTLQDPGAWIKADPMKEDYVRVAPGGRYFVHADGSFYTPIGYNHNPEWTDFTLSAPASPSYDPEVTDGFFKRLHDSGVNLIRMMTENPLGGAMLEKPVGTFLPEQVAWIDNLVKCARKHDVKLMITPWDTFWMGRLWNDNPYNAANGGPVEKKLDFLTKREAIEAQKKRWKFIIDRWGNTGTIFAWELLNEADYWWEGSPEQVIAWAKEMGDFVRRYEKEKWGRNHLITISTGRPMPHEGWAELAYRLPGIDLATTHLYIGAANAPEEPIGPALAEKEGVTYCLANIRDNRPYIDGENGPINRWIADGNLDNEVFHNMSWAHMASGGAGSGLRWPYRGPHHLSDGMYHTLSLMSRFAEEVPWRKLTGPFSEIKVTAPEGWISCSTGTKESALVWVTSAKPSSGTLSISWPDGPKSVRYRCYDTKTGDWIKEGTITPDKGLSSIALDGARPSVAVILEQRAAR